MYIGLDIGTGSCKALAVDENAQVLGSAAAEYPCYTPHPGWSEQHPADWWAGCCSALKELAAQTDLSRASCMALSGQMHGMVALDDQNEVLRPAILWNDQRTAAECAELIAAAGGGQSLLELTNNTMLTGFTGGKVLWFQKNEPALFAKCKLIINPKDYINFKLTGALATDVSDASGTGFYDVRRNCWSGAFIEKSGIPASLFAKAYESTDVIGAITQAAADSTGLPAGLPVLAGGGDAVLSAVGMGLAGDGDIAVTVGTSGVVARHAAQFYENEGAKLQFSRSCLRHKFHVMGVTLAAAGSYQWHEGVLGDQRLSARGARYRAMDEEAAQSPAGANGVMFLPYLSGERCPVNDPAATSCFVGLRASSTRGDMSRAVLEGVAFSLRQVYDLMAAATGPAERVILAGGGAKSPLWRQIFADVFALPVVTLEAGGEGGALAAALLAAVSREGEGILSRLKIKSRTAPEPKSIRTYEESYARYGKLYPALLQIR
jgi:xylulokinase